MRTTWALVITVMALLCGATAAQAGTVWSQSAALGAQTGDPGAPASGRIASGPVLAGGGIAWAQEDTKGALAVFTLRPGADAAPRQVFTAPTIQWALHSLVLQGSPTRLAWTETQLTDWGSRYRDPNVDQARVMAGPPGGPFTTIAGCDDGNVTACAGDERCFTSGGLGRAVLAGDTLEVLDGCTYQHTALAAGDVSVTTRTFDLTAATGAAPVRAATFTLPASSAFVPVMTVGALVLQSATAFEARRTADGSPEAAYPPFGSTVVSDAALRDDGRLVMPVPAASPSGDLGARALVWADPGDVAAHELPLPEGARVDGIDHVRVVGDTIMYVTHARGADALVVGDFAGHTRTVVRTVAATEPARVGATLTGADFDGTTATWAITSCERTTFGVSAPDDVGQAFTPRVCDTPRVVSSSVRVDRHGHVRIGITCGRACRGTLEAYSSDYGGSASARFRLTGSTAVRYVSLTVPAVVRRALRRHRTVPLKAGFDPDTGGALRGVTRVRIGDL